MGIENAYVVPHPPLIVPAVGRGMEERVAATTVAYRQVAQEIARSAPEALVVLSSHAPAYRDGFYVSLGGSAQASMADFDEPQEAFPARYHEDLARAIRKEAERMGVPTAAYEPRDGEIDHATFIPLWFLREALAQRTEEAGALCGAEAPEETETPGPPPIVRIGLSGLSADEHRTMGHAIAHAVDRLDLRVTIVASGDLSHRLSAEGSYGFRAEGPRFDALMCEAFASGDLEALFAIDDDFADAAGECGLRPFRIMAGALDGRAFEPQLLSYEGPYGVGYAVAAFRCSDATDCDSEATCNENADPYVALARAAVEHWVTTGKPLPRPNDLPSDLLNRRAGAFVSLHAYGDLRGCIGTIGPCAPTLADEIISNAGSAALHDPRFPAVSPQELDFISYSVDVLDEPEPIDSPDELDPQRYGVIVTKGFRRGLLLPMLEGVDTVEQQLAIARRKAGIGEWEDDVKLQRFEVVRHERGGEARL